MEAAGAFRDTLLGVKVMHAQQWLHGDLKPANIRLVKNPLRSILLDVGTSMRLKVGAMIGPTPGNGGTVGYLAPKRKLNNYDFAINIWAIRVIGYKPTYGNHPWKLSLNPWRNGKSFEQLQPTFQDTYKEIIRKLSNHYQNAKQSPVAGFVHRKYSLHIQTRGRSQRKKQFPH